jgi:hypothetical protein
MTTLLDVPLRYAEQRAWTAEGLTGGLESGHEDARLAGRLLPVVVKEILDVAETMRWLWAEARAFLEVPRRLDELSPVGDALRFYFGRVGRLLRRGEKACREVERLLGYPAEASARLTQAAADFEAWSRQALASWPDASWLKNLQPDPARAGEGAKAFAEGRFVDAEELLARWRSGA